MGWNGRGNKKEINPMSIIDTPFNEKEHSTRNIISSEIGKSTGWVGMAEVTKKK